MPPTEQLYKNGSLTLFHADDDADDAMIFKEAICEINDQIKVRVIHNGDELVELLTHIQPDMLFLDLEMPGKNGLECLVDIRKMKHYRNLPIIVFSSTTRPANIETAYEMGADLFFVKPYKFDELVTSLQSILLMDWSDPSKIKEQCIVNGRYTAYT
jgi:CheY-like chemotaxis protein